MGHFFNCLALTIVDHVSVNPKRDARVRVPHLRLRNLWRRSHLEQLTRVEVSEGVQATPRNFQAVKDRPESLHHNFVTTIRSHSVVRKEPPFRRLAPAPKILRQDFRESLRHRQGALTGLAFNTLDVTTDHRTANTQDLSVEVEIIDFQPEQLAGANPRVGVLWLAIVSRASSATKSSAPTDSTSG